MARRANVSRALLALMAMAVVAACAALIAIAKPTSAQPTSAPPGRSVEGLEVSKPGRAEPGPLSAVQKRAIKQGYLVPDQEAYARHKAEANARTTQASDPSAQAPTFSRAGFLGIRDTTSGPSDATSAIGPTRFIELVNTRFAIYNRSSSTPLSQGTLNTLVGEPESNNVFDPQIMWDPTTNRFYYVMDDVVSGTDNRIAFGYSKTASPNSAADFCQYVIGFGSEFPDYPKLGDTSNLILFGTNTFDGGTGSFLGSDVYSVTKPAAGSTCQDASLFTVGGKLGLSDAFTPVPAQQTDTAAAGYVVAEDDSIYQTGTGTDLKLYTASKSSTGGLNLSAAKSVNVADYKMPPSASQKGTTRVLDTLDGRNTQAVSAIDPRFGKVALWTQHTVSNGATSPLAQVRWYEINPATAGFFQQGRIPGGTGTHAFNAAISPDRKVSGATKAFGNSMVVNYNTSSSSIFPRVLMRSKIGSGAISAPVGVKNSTTFLNDFTCVSGTCRWGDYAAATPDPGSPATGTTGAVWSTTNFVQNTGSSSGAGWGTWNWAARP